MSDSSTRAEASPVSNVLFPDFPSVSRQQVENAAGCILSLVAEHEKEEGITSEMRGPGTQSTVEKMGRILDGMTDREPSETEIRQGASEIDFDLRFAMPFTLAQYISTKLVKGPEETGN